jgi:hypothetical protein
MNKEFDLARNGFTSAEYVSKESFIASKAASGESTSLGAASKCGTKASVVVALGERALEPQGPEPLRHTSPECGSRGGEIRCLTVLYKRYKRLATTHRVPIVLDPPALPVEGRFGGFREDEFESLALSFDLVSLARRPVLLRS